MNTSHFIPQVGQMLSIMTAEYANYRLLTSSDETAVYYRKVTEQQAVYVVTAGPQRLISCITSELSVATYASMLPERRRKP